MIIGIISDTHDNIYVIDKSIEIFRSRNIDHIIHLGDIISPFALARYLNQGFKVTAVYGNNDGEKIGLYRLASMAGSNIYEQPYQINMLDKRILLIHGFGEPDNTRTFIEKLASSKFYDAILYGHTHKIDVRTINDTLIINPGEACGYLTGRATLGILNVRSMDLEIIDIVNNR